MRNARSSLAAALCAAVLAALVPWSGRVPTARAQPVPADGDGPVHICSKAKGQVTVSFKAETELKDLISWAMTFTCKNFMHDSTINTRSKKVTIISPNKMSPTEAYRLFLAALSSMGLTVVPKGNVLKIVESGTAKGETLPLRKGSLAAADEMVRFVMRPTFMPANQLNEALAIVRSKDGTASVVGSALVITDYASHIRDMVGLARELDKPSANEGIYTIPVEHADAKDIASKLNEILGIGGGGGSGGGGSATVSSGKGGKGEGQADISAAVPSKILTDDRSNTLIVLATEPGYLRVRALVKRLDLALPTGDGGSIHVYPLANATAEELATTLNAALQGQQRSSGGQTRNPTAPGRGGSATPSAAGAGGELGSALEGEVRITHDAPTNSLVVVATGRDFLAIKDVIRKLDVAQRQVYIEAVILEVQLGTSRSLGSSSHGGLPDPLGDDTGVMLGGVQTPDLKSTSLATLLGANGLIGGLIGPPLPNAERLGLGTSFPSYAVLFQALATTSNTNVLSTPFIMATDNKESEIAVGQNIPYVSQSTTSFIPGQTSLPVGQSISREKLLLSMKIKPHVNDSDMVRLEIEQEIKDIGERDPTLGPTWTERKVKTQVVVRDQQSIVIGGLMQDKVIFGEAKVPLLGDIPILGYLFKHTTKEKRKTNLLILLTPYVVKDQLDIEQILERKARERNEFLRAFANLDTMKYLPRIDYRRKRGLVEEINRTIEGVERDAKYLESMGSLAAPPEGLIRYDRASDDKIEDDDEDGAAEPPKVDAPTPAPEAVPAAKPAAAKPAAAKPAAAKPAATKPAAEAGER
ncbi:MAG: type II secretion system secretin GspD [Kofleriaceae bacterium]|jgi:general secretion pathway protein D|nr:type II secretion system secretin GspD [Kofleriaceae bacterium]